MDRIGVVHHPIFQEHDPGAYHPETPRRLAALEEILSGPAAGLFVDVEPRPATEEEITWIHSPEHFAQVAATAGKEQAALDPDTRTSPRSFEAAMMAAGGIDNDNLSPMLKSLSEEEISDEDVADMVEFLKALSGDYPGK